MIIQGESVKQFFRGLVVGGADIVPGISGGTMLLVLGAYRRLIDSLSSGFSAVGELIRANPTDARRHLIEVEWTFVIPLAIGVVSGILVGAMVILGFIESYPHESQGLFFGLVAASILVPWQSIQRHGTREIMIAVLAAIAGFLLSGLPQSLASDPGLLRVFGSAAVAICAMILPGVSGGFLLKAMGMYEVSLDAIRSADVIYIAVFVLGAATGLGLFSKLLKYLLDHFNDITMAVLVGLMAGALRALWPYLGESGELLGPSSGDPIWSVIVCGVIGFGFVLMLIFAGRRLEKTTPHSA